MSQITKKMHSRRGSQYFGKEKKPRTRIACRDFRLVETVGLEPTTSRM